MSGATKEDIKKLNDALLDQKTIEQLSTTGNAAKAKRDKLKEKREVQREKEVEKAVEEYNKPKTEK